MLHSTKGQEFSSRVGGGEISDSGPHNFIYAFVELLVRYMALTG